MYRTKPNWFTRVVCVIPEQKYRATVLLVSNVILMSVSFALMNSAYADTSPFDHSDSGAAPSARPKLSTAKDYYARGTKESADKQYDDALTDFDEALRLNPNYGEAFGNRGAAKFNLQNYSGALSDYKAALKFFPGNQALLNLKTQAESALAEQSDQTAQAAEINRIRARAAMGGDFADPSTMIMMNAQQRGLIPPGGDLSDPATIIMMNARRRGLIP